MSSEIERFFVRHSADNGTAASRPELDKLLRERKKAELQANLTPPGLARDGMQGDEVRRESRIRQIEWSLDAAKDRAVIDFSLGQTRSKAKDGFDRSR